MYLKCSSLEDPQADWYHSILKYSKDKGFLLLGVIHSFAEYHPTVAIDYETTRSIEIRESSSEALI